MISDHWNSGETGDYKCISMTTFILLVNQKFCCCNMLHMVWCHCLFWVFQKAACSVLMTFLMYKRKQEFSLKHLVSFSIYKFINYFLIRYACKDVQSTLIKQIIVDHRHTKLFKSRNNQNQNISGLHMTSDDSNRSYCCLWLYNVWLYIKKN